MPDEVVVLGEDEGRAAREVQREGGIALAEVVLIEDELLRELTVVAEDEPADAWIYEPELVTRDVDRLHRGQAEVPREVGIREGEDEAAARGVDVHGHLESTAGEFMQHRVDPGDVVAVTGERRTDDGDHPDRVLVDPRRQLVGADGVAPAR